MKKQLKSSYREYLTSLTHQRLKYLPKDIVFAVLIAISPLVLYSYLCFPMTKTWETHFFTFTSLSFQNFQAFMWIFLQKFVFTYLLIIWFLTSKSWWSKAILIPIGMLTYQAINLFNDEIRFKDEESDAIFIFPMAVFILFVLMKVRKRIVSKLELLGPNELIDIDIEKIKEKCAKKTTAMAPCATDDKELENIKQQRIKLLQTDSVIAILIALSPLIFYTYLCFPMTKTWETHFFTFTSLSFQNFQAFMWILLQKVMILVFLIIWFITSGIWWNKAILIPIATFSYQIINLLNDELIDKDTSLDIVVVIPIIVVIIYMLLKIRNKIAYNLEVLSLKEIVDIEIEKAKNRIKETI